MAALRSAAAAIIYLLSSSNLCHPLFSYLGSLFARMPSRLFMSGVAVGPGPVVRPSWFCVILLFS